MIFHAGNDIGFHLVGAILAPSHECDAQQPLQAFFGENDVKLIYLKFFECE